MSKHDSITGADKRISGWEIKERIEWLLWCKDTESEEEWNTELAEELDKLNKVAEEACDLDDLDMIHVDTFQAYAQELAEDTEAVNKDARWPNNHIDWEAAAHELSSDYSSIDFDGSSYYYRG